MNINSSSSGRPRSALAAGALQGLAALTLGLLAISASMSARADESTPATQDAERRITIAEALEDRRAILESLSETRSEWETVRRAQLSRLDERLAELEARRDDADSRLTALREEVARLEGRRSREGRKERALEQAIEAPIPLARVLARRLKDRFIAREPEQPAESLAEISRIEAGLEDPDAIGRVEALKGLLEMVSEDLRRARETELSNRAIELDDGRVRLHVYELRLGLVSKLAVSEDGDRVAVAVPATAGEPAAWSFALGNGEARAAREAIAALRRDAQTRMVALPFRVATPLRPHSESTLLPMWGLQRAAPGAPESSPETTP